MGSQPRGNRGLRKRHIVGNRLLHLLKVCGGRRGRAGEGRCIEWHHGFDDDLPHAAGIGPNGLDRNIIAAHQGGSAQQERALGRRAERRNAAAGVQKDGAGAISVERSRLIGDQFARTDLDGAAATCLAGAVRVQGAVGGQFNARAAEQR